MEDAALDDLLGGLQPELYLLAAGAGGQDGQQVSRVGGSAV
jgi:hypothetical protein